MLAEESSRSAVAGLLRMIPQQFLYCSLALSLCRSAAPQLRARAPRRFSPLFSSSSSSMSEMVRGAVRDHWHGENKGYNGRRIQWSIVSGPCYLSNKVNNWRVKGEDWQRSFPDPIFCSLVLAVKYRQLLSNVQ